VSAASSTWEDTAAATAAVDDVTAASNALETLALAAHALNLPEAPLSPPALATDAAVSATELPAQNEVTAICAEGAGGDCMPREPAGHAPAAGLCATSANTCEPGAEFESGANTCEHGEGATSADAAAGSDTSAGC